MGRYWARRRRMTTEGVQPYYLTITDWGDLSESEHLVVEWDWTGPDGSLPLTLECWETGEPDTLLQRQVGHQIHNEAYGFEEFSAFEDHYYYCLIYGGGTLLATSATIEGWIAA